METVPAGVPLGFEVTFDSGALFVGMSVYEDTGPEPVLLLSPFPMALVAGNTYRGKFTPLVGKSYIIIKGVYTDDTYSELDPNYSQGSESCIAEYWFNDNGNDSTCLVVGIVENSPELVGVVEC